MSDFATAGDRTVAPGSWVLGFNRPRSVMSVNSRSCLGCRKWLAIARGFLIFFLNFDGTFELRVVPEAVGAVSAELTGDGPFEN